MKKLILYLFLSITGLIFITNRVYSQSLNSKLNIDASGKFFQIGSIGGTNSRWVMKGVHSCISHITPDGGDPSGWEGGSHMKANWDNRIAQVSGMRNYGINTVRLWMPGPLGRENPNPSYTGTTMDQHYDEIVQYIQLCKQNGLFVIMEDWWAGYLMDGNTAEYYNKDEWHDKMQSFINRLAAAGCDNVMFGTGNEEGQIRNQAGKSWSGNWKDNTKLMIAGYRRLGFTGPILVDVSGWDNQPGDVGSFAEIQNSDPAKNIGFQEHEYFNWNGAANGYFYMPVCRASYNGGMACENFPIFVTEYAHTADWVVDAFAELARNKNLGGMCYFWYNNIYGAATTNGDGINLSDEGKSSRDHFWLAKDIPGGYYPSGNTISTPSVTTTMPTNITNSSASSGGNVVSDGGANVTERGVCWGVNVNPTIANNKTSNGNGTGSFSSAITGLNANSTYHVRAYATNSAGTSYGTDVTFTNIIQPVSKDLALKKPVTYSSIEKTGTEASLAVDGDVNTRWSTSFSDPQWLTVDLGAMYDITSVKIFWDFARASDYEILVSNDGNVWTSIYKTQSGSGTLDELNGLTGSGRYIKMYGTIRTTGWGYSINSFEVYGSPNVLTSSSDFSSETFPGNELELLIYPEPVVSGLFCVKLDGQKELADITIYNLQGNKVYANQILPGENKIIESCFVPGMYFVKVSGNNFSKKRKVFIR